MSDGPVGDLATLERRRMRYDVDSANGLTREFRPPNRAPSGVTFREALPEAVFRWVLIHELGHYFFAGEPRFTPAEAPITWEWITANARSCLEA